MVPGRRTVDVEAALKRCETANTTVAGVLQASDRLAARGALYSARDDCLQAAELLADNPLPYRDNAAVAEAIRRMARGLGQIGDALDQLEKAPAQARRKAQAGAREYEAGLNKLKAS